MVHERWLVLFFLISLLGVNPWVRGDGVGYYAFARAPLIGHNFDFEPDYVAANTSFRESKLDESGHPNPFFLTPTGHLDNHFTVGPALLWSPFLVAAHGGVLLARALGSRVAPDGFSAPYRVAMAFGTAFWGFLGLLLSFRLARQYTGDFWALLATVTIWWASSLPVYMYFNPSWSHAHSAFAVALFVYCWHETRVQRSGRQWLLLALSAGLMVNVYYANAMMLMVLMVEAAQEYGRLLQDEGWRSPKLRQLVLRHSIFIVITVVSLLPTFITRYIVYGSPLASGYAPLRAWSWRSPFFLAVLFSSEHGLFLWTPILLLATVGLFIFWRREPRVGSALVGGALAFYVFIACYPDWAGISSFGNRFFVSLTVLFILGLGVLLNRVGNMFPSPRAAVATLSLLAGIFIFWNVEFLVQWGEHLIPSRGPISWNAMIHNQFNVVPRQLTEHLQHYVFHRHELMQQIEDRDLEQLNHKKER